MMKKFAVILALSLILLFLYPVAVPALNSNLPPENSSVAIYLDISPYRHEPDVFPLSINPSPTRAHPYSIIAMKDKLFDGIKEFFGKIYTFLKYASENYLP